MDKKELIFQATFDLLKEDRHFNELTIQEIATKAGIGKGTIYDYFSSKDMILIETIIYFINIEIDKVKAIVVKDCSFKMTVKMIYDQVIKSRKKLTSYEIATRNDDIFKDKKICESGLLESIIDTLDLLIEKGRKEKIINDKYDIEYCRYVIISVINGLTFHSIHNINNDEINYQYAYQIIEKSLSY